MGFCTKACSSLSVELDRYVLRLSKAKAERKIDTDRVFRGGVFFAQSFFSFVVFVLLCTITYGSTSHPIVKGTFIQEWLTVHWTDEMWDSELEYLKEVGIEFLIVAPTGFGIGDGNLRTIYPSKSPTGPTTTQEWISWETP